MSAARVLLDAADLLQRSGWCRMVLWDEAGRCCANGAICSTRADSDECFEAIRALAGHVGDEVTHWNDRPTQTAENVIATMREVAASLEAS